MKIAQFYHYQQNRLRLGSIEDDSLIPLDFQGDMIDFIRQRPICNPSGEPFLLDSVHFAPVVSNPSKIIGIGLNYLDHVQESKGEIPEAPIVFAKFPSSLLGHNQPITWRTELTKKVDFEGELAVVMGRTVSRGQEHEALDNIFGYACANDVSARDLQFGDKQWVRGKSLDSFCPLGPWVVTSDEISDPHSLDLKCWLNGELMQDSNTAMMIFKLPQLIGFLSESFTLFPGDVILTGTPHGVGAFRTPSIYLKDRDEIVIEIQRVGRLKNTCRAS